PMPTAVRTVAAETARWPRATSTAFKALVRSGAVSTRVPSRSNTTVASLKGPCGTVASLRLRLTPAGGLGISQHSVRAEAPVEFRPRRGFIVFSARAVKKRVGMASIEDLKER